MPLGPEEARIGAGGGRGDFWMAFRNRGRVSTVSKHHPQQSISNNSGIDNNI